MAEHPALRARQGNVLLVRFGWHGPADARAEPGHPTCRSCAHWSADDGREGFCLADCGARCTPAQGRCGQWHRPPLRTVV